MVSILMILVKWNEWISLVWEIGIKSAVVRRDWYEALVYEAQISWLKFTATYTPKIHCDVWKTKFYNLDGTDKNNMSKK